MTLTEFLLARIAEDEAAAREPRWLAFEYGVDSAGRAAFSTRVLAECEAKRRIMARHQSSAEARGVGQHRNGKWTPYCEYESADWPCPDIADLATAYADHSDYRPEWRP